MLKLKKIFKTRLTHERKTFDDISFPKKISQVSSSISLFFFHWDISTLLLVVKNCSDCVLFLWAQFPRPNILQYLSIEIVCSTFLNFTKLVNRWILRFSKMFGRVLLDQSLSFSLYDRGEKLFFNHLVKACIVVQIEIEKKSSNFAQNMGLNF